MPVMTTPVSASAQPVSMVMKRRARAIDDRSSSKSGVTN